MDEKVIPFPGKRLVAVEIPDEKDLPALIGLIDRFGGLRRELQVTLDMTEETVDAINSGDVDRMIAVRERVMKKSR